jgi:hypothetical protein
MKRPARRMALLAITAALAIVVVAAIMFMKSGSKPAATTTRDAGVATMASKPDAAPAATIVVDASVATPAMAKVSIVTTPSGATVVYNGKTYKTPFELELPVDSGKVELTATLDGFLPGKIVVAPGDGPKRLALRKKKKVTTPNNGDEVPF